MDSLLIDNLSNRHVQELYTDVIEGGLLLFDEKISWYCGTSVCYVCAYVGTCYYGNGGTQRNNAYICQSWYGCTGVGGCYCPP